MLNRLSAILSFIGSIPLWIIGLFSAFFLSLFDLGKDILCWCFDQMLTLLIYIISSIDVSSVSFDVSSFWAVIPSQALNIMSYLYLPQAMAMIFSAIGIRLFMQLIPFVRLGS